MHTLSTLEYFAKIFYECRSGIFYKNPLAIISNDNVINSSELQLISDKISNIIYPINKKNTLDDKEKLDWREL